MEKPKAFMVGLLILTIAGLPFFLTSNAIAACPDDIVHYWKLDKPVGGGGYKDDILDQTGTGVGDLGSTTGIIKNAAVFNGTNTGINVNPTRTLNWLSSESFSIEFWINMASAPTGPGNQVVIGRVGGGTNAFWFVGVTPTNGFITFQLNDDSASLNITGSRGIADGSWHHVAVVRDASIDTNLIYVDGALDNSGIVDYTGDGFLFNTAQMNIGWLNFGGGFRLAASLDEIAVYDRALPLSEIQSHYASGSPTSDYCEWSDPPEQPKDAPFPEDTISLWSLDEAAGSTYVDTKGDNDGAGNADPTAATGQVSGAQTFDGSATGIDVAASRTFNWLTFESFSIEFWINMAAPPASGNQIVIGRSGGGTGAFWYVGVTPSGFIQFQLNDSSNSGNTTGDSSVANGSWHHVVVTRDGSTENHSIYVDGVLDESQTHNYTGDGFLFDSAALTIGRLNLGGGFRLAGLLDEVALYDRALSLSEIQAHFSAGQSGNGVQTLRPAPTASAGDDQSDVAEKTQVTLSGSGTPGYAGTSISTYQWSQTAGTTVTLTGADTATATFTAPDVGTSGETLTFRLEVTADDGQSATDDVDVGVVNIVAPVANAGDDKSVAENTTGVTLDGSATGTGTLTYLWEQVSGTTVTLTGANTATATFDAPAVDADENLVFRLTVTDIYSNSDEDEITVTVTNTATTPTDDGGGGGGCFIQTVLQ